MRDDDQLIAWARWVEARLVVKLGLIGYGAIGKHVEAAGLENIELVSVLVKRPRTGRHADARARPLLRPHVRCRRRMRRPRGRAHARPARAGKRRGLPRDLRRRLHRHGPVRSAAGRGQGQRRAADPAVGRHRRARHPEQRRGRRARQRHRDGAQGPVGLERHDRRDAGRSRHAARRRTPCSTARCARAPSSIRRTSTSRPPPRSPASASTGRAW